MSCAARIIVGLAIATTLLSGCNRAEQPTETALAVQAVQAKTELLSNVIELTGTVGSEPNKSAHVTSVIQGVLDYVGPRVGDWVEKGQIVARLQDSVQAAQV